MSGNILILHVTGMLRPFTKVRNIFLAFSGLPRSATPIPPFTENSLGHPMFTSMPATSGSTFKKKKVVYFVKEPQDVYSCHPANNLLILLLLKLVQHHKFQFEGQPFAFQLRTFEIQQFHRHHL